MTDADRPAPARSRRSPRTVKGRAVGHLARREYSRAELRAVLLRGEPHAADVDAAEVDAALDELAAQGLLSDARFAYAVVRQKSGSHSKRAISETLKAKGVTGDAAADAIKAHAPDDDATLIALWQRRFGKPPENDREKARQVRFLQSRGFALSAIFKLLRNPPS